MAGYLLRMADDYSSFELVYGDVSQTSANEALLTLYTRETCECVHETLQITGMGCVAGAYSNVFELGKCLFCARSRVERDVWVRGLCNISTKVNLGVERCEENFRTFRMAILERVVEQLSLPEPDPELERANHMYVVPNQPNPPPLKCNDTSPSGSFESEL